RVEHHRRRGGEAGEHDEDGRGLLRLGQAFDEGLEGVHLASALGGGARREGHPTAARMVAGEALPRHGSTARWAPTTALTRIWLSWRRPTGSSKTWPCTIFEPGSGSARASPGSRRAEWTRPRPRPSTPISRSCSPSAT